ncbi:MAG: NAD(P)-dependent oxidoreductase [Azospirillaceae bacterium]|nr:NAD(P)-dependent oxidoreductase [Azospirillaceae bacterium]
MTKRIAFIGLGVMGAPMARHLIQKGHEVMVYNRSTAKAEAWVAAHGGRFATLPRLAARDADLVACCVGNDDDVRAVVLGPDGALAGMEAGSVLVDHTTASAELARELAAAAAARGVGFLDAPVSGGQAGAENGALTVMVGGEAATFEIAQPVLSCYARAVTLMGPVGAGQLTKMVNQICIAGTVQGLSEALNFAQKAGLDGDRVIDVIAKGAAQSWQMENRGRTMLRDQFDFGFAVNWMRKDLAICLEEASRNGAALPVTAIVDQLYALLQAAGGGRWDTSSLIRNLSGTKRS